MKPDEIASMGGNAVGYVLSALQQNEVLQIITFVLNSLLTVALIAFRVWAWYKQAKKDGKITKEEIDEAIDILNEGKDKTEK